MADPKSTVIDKIVKAVTEKLAEKAPAEKGALNAVAKDPMRGILATPDLRNMTTEEAIKAASSNPHIMTGAEGQYVGAPRGIGTPDRLQIMRENFDKDVATGAEGADWYPRAREYNISSQGDSPARQSLAAGEQALWSAQANPDTNLGWAQLARNNYEAGHPLEKIRTGAQARNYIESRQAAEQAAERNAINDMIGHNGGPSLDETPMGSPRLGKKTGIYGQHLDPTVPFATTGTNDIWHARGFGYTNNDGGTFSRALTPQEHRFLDYETMLAVDRANAQKLAGRDDWTAHEIQAAPWVAGKGRSVGMAEASKTYPDYARKYNINVTHEQIPGQSTGLMPHMINASDAEKQAFHNAATWKDSMGRDRLYSDLNMYVSPDQEQVGSYVNSAGKLENNPVTVSRPGGGSFEFNEKGNPVLSKLMQRTMDTTQGLRGLMDFQEGSPYHKIVTHGGGPDRTSLDIKVGRPLTKEEMNKAYEVANKHGFDLANSENGISFLNRNDPAWGGDATTTSVGKQLKGGLSQDIQSMLPEAEINRGRLQGNYIDLSKELSAENQGKGLATKKFMDLFNETQKHDTGYAEKLMNSSAIPDKARSNLARLQEYGGSGQRPDYERLLNILGEGGLRALMDRINKVGYAGLPAVGGLAMMQDKKKASGSEGE